MFIVGTVPIELTAACSCRTTENWVCDGGGGGTHSTCRVMADPAVPALKQEAYGVGYLCAESMALTSSCMRWEDSGTIA